MSGFLEKLVKRLVPDDKKEQNIAELDERFFATPSVALQRAHNLTIEMAHTAVGALKDSLKAFENYSKDLAESIHAAEEKRDHYEDILGTYLV